MIFESFHIPPETLRIKDINETKTYLMIQLIICLVLLIYSWTGGARYHHQSSAAGNSLLFIIILFFFNGLVFPNRINNVIKAPANGISWSEIKNWGMWIWINFFSTLLSLAFGYILASSQVLKPEKQFKESCKALFK